MKKFFIVFILMLLTQGAYAFDIVYPKQEAITVNSPTTFFIGSSKKDLYLNGELVVKEKSGAFAKFVQLQTGENIFGFSSKNDKKTFVITRQSSEKEACKPKDLIIYDKDKYFAVNYNNAPLRSEPLDYGINRLSHLQNGVMLIVDGEFGDFYRVKSDKNYAWILKKHVKEIGKFEPAILKSQKIEESYESFKFTFCLDKKVSYSISENENLTLQFYNTDKKLLLSFPYKQINGMLVGYSAKYDGNNFILTIRKPPLINKKYPLKNVVITVDAGHGGSEFGAISPFGDREKDIVLNMAEYLRKKLIKCGANVVMTRINDENVSLSDRVNIANDTNSMIFVSIHNDALPDTLDPNLYKGATVYYYYDEAKQLAKAVSDIFTEKLKINSNGIKRQSFAVVRNHQALSILIETGFLINPKESILLRNKKYQKKCAKAIAKGIENYLIHFISSRPERM